MTREEMATKLRDLAYREREYLAAVLDDKEDPHVIAQWLEEAAGMLESRVLTLRGVERIGADNHGSFKNDGLTVLWLEEFGKQYPLHVVVLKWDEDDWRGDPNDIVDVYYFGTDEFDQFSLTDYNKAWRCWTYKPTETQRMGAAWDA